MLSMTRPPIRSLMPVGLGAGRALGADGAARAGAVLHHHRLIPPLCELLADDARDDVGAAARREGDDNSHGLGGKGFCHPRQQQQSQKKTLHEWEKSTRPAVGTRAIRIRPMPESVM